jgi:hypothetical protein
MCKGDKIQMEGRFYPRGQLFSRDGASRAEMHHGQQLHCRMQEVQAVPAPLKQLDTDLLWYISSVT